MDYGFYIATSGALAAKHRQDVLSNNLANVETTGFKPNVVLARQRVSAREEDGLNHLPSDALIERLGAGVLMEPSRISHAQGRLERTGNDLDIALEGKGFLAVRDGADTSGDGVRFTRDGRMTIGPERELILSSTGMPVLDTNNRPIRLADDAPVAIDRDGAIRQNGEVVARLGLYNVPDPDYLPKMGDNLFAVPPNQYQSREASSARVNQGFLESSATNDIKMMIDIQSAAGDFGTNIAMIRNFDTLMDRAINRLGRVA
ncbi:MAG: flagellar hook basal-body protein [Phycisphaerales bacterium]|nr:flagellar hook basal-body protein [Phycisphaerales bacterium]